MNIISPLNALFEYFLKKIITPFKTINPSRYELNDKKEFIWKAR